MSRELEKERKQRESLEGHAEELEKTLTLRVSREDLVAAKEEADRERERRMNIEVRIKRENYSEINNTIRMNME